MKKKMEMTSSVTKLVSKGLINFSSPSSISYLWNMGSMLGIVLTMQILSGVFLSMHYSPSLTTAFESTIHIMRDVNMGATARVMHSNGASIFFILIFMHITRGIINSSFKKVETWFSGTVILFMLMGTAFLGYVLPWGQMSFWGATVITSLASAIPMVGGEIVKWLWGGFSVSEPTLNRFFSLHFLLPFMMSGMAGIHLISLHSSSHSNPLGSLSQQDKMNFHPLFSIKDLLYPSVVLTFFTLINLKWPYMMMDPENFMIANPMNTPIHIQPEWYFLFAYAILRSIPNKLMGVIALLMSILILTILPLKKSNPSKFNPSTKTAFTVTIFSFATLTWVGAMPMEFPFTMISKIVGTTYFLSFMNYYLTSILKMEKSLNI